MGRIGASTVMEPPGKIDLFPKESTPSNGVQVRPRVRPIAERSYKVY